jgi:hypothetical protein
MREEQRRPDYVWHFKLAPGEDHGATTDALTEMVRQQIEALLRCVVLTNNGEHLKVTGFRFLDEHDQEHAVRPRAGGWSAIDHGPAQDVHSLDGSDDLRTLADDEIDSIAPEL